MDTWVVGHVQKEETLHPSPLQTVHNACLVGDNMPVHAALIATSTRRGEAFSLGQPDLITHYLAGSGAPWQALEVASWPDQNHDLI